MSSTDDHHVGENLVQAVQQQQLQQQHLHSEPQQQQQQQHLTQVSPKKKRNEPRYQSGMRPSIVTTINNTSPNNNTDPNNTAPRSRQRANEPYESYIEDSFVGHWEHEDDEDEYQEDFDAESQDGNYEDKSELHHPSTIEFDFDSFGPESIIYSPPTTTSTTTVSSPVSKNVTTTAPQPSGGATTTTIASNTSNTTAATNPRPPPLLEVSREAEKADELPQSDNGTLSPSIQSSDQSRDSTPMKTATTTISQVQSPRSHHISAPIQEYLVDPAQIDLKVIEPYKKVISHAGYCNHFDPSVPSDPTPPGVQPPAVIVFSACYLPDRSRRDYNYVMDHLFLYVLTSLHELIADDYILIYLHNTQPPNPSASSYPTNSAGGGASTSSTTSSESEGQNQNNLPTFTWMKRCYQMIDRRLRKNLRILYLVKPTFWLKTIVIMCKPFISAKFSKKLRFVEDMNTLRKCLPVDKLILPASAENL